MKAWTEKDIENLIQNSVFPNPVHKNALRERLMGSDVSLDLADLDKVAGGKALPEQEKWEAWPEPGENKQ